MSENTVRRHHPPLDHVMAVLNLRQSSPETFEGYSLPDISGRIYGGQVMAQALIAAGATVPESGVDARAVHSFHCYFLRPGKLHEPVTFHVERLHDGRSFSTRRTHAIQHDKPILSMILSFQKEQEGFDHYARMPNVPAPSELKGTNEVYSQLAVELAS